MSDNTVVVRVTRMKVQTKYGSSHLEVEPVGDLLFSIKVPEEFIKYDIVSDKNDVIEVDLEALADSISEGKTRIFTVEGIQHTFKGLQVALSYQIQEGDF